jgi:hypothetical protein
MDTKSKAEQLEAVFHTADMLKVDLSETKDSVDVSNSHDHLTLDRKVAYSFDKQRRQLKRSSQGVPRSTIVMLCDVTDFYITFFPEVPSVFYRIEINGKEQIRGYIFLNSFANKKEGK